MDEPKGWQAIADDYARTCGRTVSPTDTVEYPMQIMSLLSDALSEMIAAAREAERAASKT